MRRWCFRFEFNNVRLVFFFVYSAHIHIGYMDIIYHGLRIYKSTLVAYDIYLRAELDKLIPM